MKRLWHIFTVGVILIGLTAGTASQENASPYYYEGTVAEGGSWDADIGFSAASLITGEELKVDVNLRIQSTGLAHNLSKTRGLYCLLTGRRLFDGSGQYIGDTGALLSAHLTSSGMPIESEDFRVPHTIFGSKRVSPVTSYVRLSPDELRINLDKGEITAYFTNIIPIEKEIPPGFYKIRLDFGIEVTPTMRLTLNGIDPASVDAYDTGQSYIESRLVDINAGATPRMIWTLFSQFHPGGGALPLEDKGLAALSRRRGSFDRCILPLKDQFGRQVRYLLEPDFPSEINPLLRRSTSTLDLDYNSGSVSLRIKTPTGIVIDCGSAPLIGPRGMGVTTGSESFFFSFSQYGRHFVECRGWITDKYGTVFQGGGIYEIWVAQPIVIDPATPPGKPVKVNELYNTGVHLYPALPADVRISRWLERGATGKVEQDSTVVRANRFGQFVPNFGAAKHRSLRSGVVLFPEPGLYRVLYQAEYSEPDGTLWMGQLESFGVVYTETTGDAGGTTAPELVLPFPSTEKPGNQTYRVEYPLKIDNIIFLPEKNFTFFDPLLTFKPANYGGIFRGDEDVLIPVGELRGLCSGTGAAVSPVSYYEKINRIGVQCFSAVRSDGICQMGIAELSQDSETHPHRNPFNSGELPREKPGDYYILNGGLYYKDLMNADNLGLPYVTGAFVTSDYANPVYYQGAGVEINDQLMPRDMFTGFHAIRPGDILCKGDPFVIDSVAFPNTPVDYEIAITQPDGMVFRKRGSSDRFGYINNPELWHELKQEGVFQISYVIFRGEKSGAPIGTSVEKGASFNIYVIDRSNNNRVNFNLERVTELNTTKTSIIRGDVTEAGIVGGRVYITASFQGALVEETVVDVVNGEFKYTIDPVGIATQFPNYSISDPNDRIDITFFVMGLTANGKVRYAADKLYTYASYLYAVPLKYEEIKAEDRRAREQKLKREEKGKELRRIRGRQG